MSDSNTRYRQGSVYVDWERAHLDAMLEYGRQTPKIDQKEHKMDRFKRFLGKFALYFGIFAVLVGGIYVAFAFIEAINAKFGHDIATMAVIIIFGSVFAAAWAWLNSETPD